MEGELFTGCPFRAEEARAPRRTMNSHGFQPMEGELFLLVYAPLPSGLPSRNTVVNSAYSATPLAEYM
ncbi:MAG: hypothetical protein AB1646_18665, partial [Thermodesulfobacteriota bacterium]